MITVCEKTFAGMKTRKPLVPTNFRNIPILSEMITDIVEISGLSQSDVIRSCLVMSLPKLIKQYDVTRRKRSD